jgi:hypothetical protein
MRLQDGVIPCRTRQFREEMRSESIEESKNELKTLLSSRRVSPTIKMHFEEMIETAEEVQNMKRSGVDYVAKSLRLCRQESVLARMLDKDRTSLLGSMELKRLVEEQFLLRYGDYYSANLYEVRKVGAQISKREMSEDILNIRQWRQISDDIISENIRALAYEKALEARRPYEAPLTPTLDHLRDIAAEMKVRYENIFFQITQYAARCDVAHSGVAVAVRERSWEAVAKYINKDRDILLYNTEIKEIVDQRGEIFVAMQQFENRYFKKIHLEWSDETGKDEVAGFELSPKQLEIEEEEKKVHKSRQRMKQLSSEQDEVIGRAKAISEDDGAPIVRARNVLLSASEELDEAKAYTKKSQQGLSTKENALNAATLRFIGIEEEKAE